MEDGAPAHCAAMTKQWHTQHGVKFFGGWLGNSPDLNPIESLWSQMKQLQSKERATSAAGLKKIASKVWGKITPSYLKSLYESMPRRLLMPREGTLSIKRIPELYYVLFIE